MIHDKCINRTKTKIKMLTSHFLPHSSSTHSLLLNGFYMKPTKTHNST